VDCEITSAQGWAWFNIAVESEMTINGPVAVRSGLGYIGQEREAIMKRNKLHG
jgi:hypothetical protein